MRLGPGMSPVIPRTRGLGNLHGPAPRPAYPLHGRRLSPTGWPRPPCGWLLVAMAEEHAAGSSSKKAASARGGPPAAGSSRRRPTATPPAAPPAERPQGWGRGPSLPCLFLLPRSSQGTPKEHRRKLFAGSLVPNHRKLSR
jgi:hypothetical protein